MRPTHIHLHRDHLRHNLARVRECAPNSRVVSMVKANAYGHGVETSLAPLDDTDSFGVCSLEEGMVLRHLGVKKPIVLVEGMFDVSEMSEIVAHQFDLVVHHAQQIDWLAQFPADFACQIWLKIDTGMHRLGFLPSEVSPAWQRICALPIAKSKPILMTHLSDADYLMRSKTLEQLALFDEHTQSIVAEKSLCNSAGILGWPQAHAQWVRPGIMLYGCSPFADKTREELSLKPAMSLRSQLIAVKKLAQGESVGYGSTWTCPHESMIGVVAIGYGDGYPRHAPSGTPMLVNGVRCPLVGTVSMDMVMVDLTTQPHAKIGDAVELWGEGLAVEVVAQFSKTISYELLCGITSRVRRVIE